MMRAYLYWTFATILRLRVALASNFDTALDLVVRYHGKDTKGLSKTVDTLTQIATRLRDEPDDPKFRSIRLLNKTFWERIGSVNGGIPFMTAMGFDLVDQGERYCSTIAASSKCRPFSSEIQRESPQRRTEVRRDRTNSRKMCTCCSTVDVLCYTRRCSACTELQD